MSARERTWQFAWMLLVLIAVPVVAAILKGSYRGPDSWSLWIASFGAIVGAIAFVVPRADKHGRTRVAVVAVAACTTMLATLHHGTTAYEPALIQLGPVLAGLLIITGSDRAGVLAGTVAVLGNATLTFVLADAVDVIAQGTYGVFILAMCIGWRRFETMLRRREASLVARGVAAIEERETQERAAVARRFRAAFVESGARSVLEEILVSKSIDASTRRDAEIAEATLRDFLRSPELDNLILVSEVHAARQRGIEVRLVGRVSEGSPTISDGAAHALVRVVRQASEGCTVTVRHFAADSRGATLSVVVARDDDESTRHAFTPDGTAVPDVVGRHP